MHSILHARSISAQIAVKCKNQTQTYQDNFHHAFLSVRAAFVCLVRNRDFDACSCKAPKLYHHQIVSPSTLQASSGPSSRHRKQGGDPDPTSKGKIPSPDFWTRSRSYLFPNPPSCPLRTSYAYRLRVQMQTSAPSQEVDDFASTDMGWGGEDKWTYRILTDEQITTEMLRLSQAHGVDGHVDHISFQPCQSYEARSQDRYVVQIWGPAGRSMDVLGCLRR